MLKVEAEKEIRANLVVDQTKTFVLGVIIDVERRADRFQPNLAVRHSNDGLQRDCKGEGQKRVNEDKEEKRRKVVGGAGSVAKLRRTR